MKICIKKDCIGCGVCEKVCPSFAIKMKTDNMGFAYPQIIQRLCCNCGLCYNICPINSEMEIQSPKATYAVKADDSVRLISSSGGVFSILATHILQRGGIVCGAVWEKHNWTVEHRCITTVAELNELRGSKYQQSSLSHCFSLIKDALERNIPVLFSGTPCQNQALVSYLRKKPSHLYCIDLICHGASSPKAAQCYFKELEKKQKSPLQNIFWRFKCQGTEQQCSRFEFGNGSVIENHHHRDFFITHFDWFLRSSCYQCRFRDFRSISDIQIGDFWGAEKQIPAFFDHKGVSAVLIKTMRGESLFDTCKEQMKYIPVTLEQIVPGNPCLCASQPPQNRELGTTFFLLIKMASFLLRTGIPFSSTCKIFDGNFSLSGKIFRKLIYWEEKIKKMIHLQEQN